MEDIKIIESITNIAAVLLGFLLAQFADWYKLRREDEKERSNTQMIVDLEHRRNTSLMCYYWEKLAETDIYKDDGELSISKIGKSIIKQPLPALHNEVWKASLPKVARAFSAEELEALWEKYLALEHLAIVQVKLKELDAAATDLGRYAEMRRTSSVMAPITASFVTASHFSGSAEPLVNNFIDYLRIFLGNSYKELPKTKSNLREDYDAQ